mmetsp:Transcript_43427/g.102963  ORF Transcript_43427/g.102963 Transcript_43427/m.102963 type:complete len:210 (+) Transcript_43427:1323-1952(+)
MAQMSLICACTRAVLLRHVRMSTLSVYSLTLRQASRRRSRRRSSMLSRRGMYLQRSTMSESAGAEASTGLNPIGTSSSSASLPASPSRSSRGRFMSTSEPERACSEPRLARSASLFCCSAKDLDSCANSDIFAHSREALSRSSEMAVPESAAFRSAPTAASMPAASCSSAAASDSRCVAYSASCSCATLRRRALSCASASAWRRAMCSA